MKHAFVTMLEMQNSMNKKVHPEWVEQHFEWYRATWIECGELVDHYGYKWWKKQTPDMNQVHLEVVDIWHFGMSMLFTGQSIDDIATAMVAELSGYSYEPQGVIEATEALAEHCLRTKTFSIRLFWNLLNAVDMSFDVLYQQYVGKNVLNFFRQDNGYKTGSYVKVWHNREDNEHLVEILADLDPKSGNYAELIYQQLTSRYQSL